MSGYGPSQRPGGLTALAVVNFVLTGLGALGILGSFVLLALLDDVKKVANDPELAGLTHTIIYISILLTLLQSVLLLLSGIGYLGQRKFLGKTLGNVYALIGLAGTGVGVAMTQRFDITTIIGLTYPVLTLALLNTTFKDDFPNP
jgi:hypothetical protein